MNPTRSHKRYTKLAALLAILGVVVALLPQLPFVEACCIMEGEARPSCCPPSDAENDSNPTAQSTCCKHVAMDALIAASFVSPRPVDVDRVDIALTTFTPLILSELPLTPKSIEYPKALQTGPPPTHAIYLRNESFLL